MTTVQKGNISGIGAIFLWSILALLTLLTKKIPPFQLTFMAFSVAFIFAFAFWIRAKEGIKNYVKLPLKVWLVGIYGLFGYHFCYFLALKSAPALQANLLNYLWPLLIVLLSAFLPKEHLRWYHILGASLGFLGAFILLGYEAMAFGSAYISGYLLAVLCAFIWSSYSVLSRYFGEVPTLSVGSFLGGSAILSLVAHCVFEQTYVPSYSEMFATIALGCGPVGLAFFMWDYGMKKGDIKLIGSLSYVTPLLSTMMLMLFGQAEPSKSIWIACVLIVIGSAISSLHFFKELFLKLKTRNQPL